MSLFEPMFQELNRREIRYVVVGGVAVVLHGVTRLTVDLDLMVDLESTEAKKAVDALTSLGLQSRIPVPASHFAEPQIRQQWVREKGMQVFTMLDIDNPFRTVDLFVELPIPFEEVWEDSVCVNLGATEVRIASIPHLIQMKKISGRPKDLEDIRQIEHLFEKRRDS